MGSLLHSAWDAKELKREYNLQIAIETGTAYGEGTKFLAEIFEEVFTIEIDDGFFEDNSERLSEFSNVHAHLGKTTESLPPILEANRDTPAFFWLDAHLPRRGKHRYVTGCFVEEDHDEEINFPLEDELRVIVKNKNISKDVLLIDDLRIYENGPFEVGNWSERYEYERATAGCGFVYELLEQTHSIEKSFKDEGYLLAKPL